MGDFMNSSIRLKSKFLLSQNTLRLFLASAISFFLRWGIITFSVLCLYYFLSGNLFKTILLEYNKAIIFTAVILFSCTIFLICAVIAAAIKTGERFLFFTRAQGSKVAFKLLFKFLHPLKAFRSLRFFLTLNSLKFLWFIYFFAPVAICIGTLFYVYNGSYFSAEVNLILSISSAILFSLSFVAWRICIFRYESAIYYFCLNPSLTINNAIKKSIRFTDSFLTEGVLLEYSHLGWMLSCIFIVPLIYVVPYTKLCRSVFITENIFSRVPSRTSKYSVNLLKLIPSGQHINQRHYE